MKNNYYKFIIVLIPIIITILTLFYTQCNDDLTQLYEKKGSSQFESNRNNEMWTRLTIVKYADSYLSKENINIQQYSDKNAELNENIGNINLKINNKSIQCNNFNQKILILLIIQILVSIFHIQFIKN